MTDELTLVIESLQARIQAAAAAAEPGGAITIALTPVHLALISYALGTVHGRVLADGEARREASTADPLKELAVPRRQGCL